MLGGRLGADDDDALDKALLSNFYEEELEDIDEVGSPACEDDHASLLARGCSRHGRRPELDLAADVPPPSVASPQKGETRSRKKSSVARWLSSGSKESKESKEAKTPKKVKGVCPLCRQAVGSGAHFCASADWRVREGEKSDAARNDGNTLFWEGQYASAVGAYSEALEHTPNDAKLWSNRAAAHTLLGDYARALEDSEATIRLAPTWVKGYYRKAMLLEGRRDWVAAVDVYKQALAQCGESGEALAKARRRLPVMQAKQQIAVQAANLPAPFCTAAVKAWWLSRSSRVPRDRPGDAEFHRRMADAEVAKSEGNEKVRQHAWQAALKCYERGLLLINFCTPEPCEEQAHLDVALRLNEGLCELRLGRHAEAIKLCTEVLELEPTSVKARFRRATALNEVHDYDAALEDVELALALQPQERAVLALRQQLQERRAAHRKRQKAQFARMFDSS